MEIAIAGRGEREVYHLLTQCIVPRPIAWVLTSSTDSDGSHSHWNVAPFSYFTGLASDPPLVGFSVGNRLAGRRKDTYRNAAVGQRVVVHIASASQRDTLHGSAAELPYDTSEVELAALDLTDDWSFAVPRIAGCPVALGCTVEQYVELVAPDAQVLVVARVDTVFVSDRAVSSDHKGRLVIDPFTIDPLARLGAGRYARIAPPSDGRPVALAQPTAPAAPTPSNPRSA